MNTGWTPPIKDTEEAVKNAAAIAVPQQTRCYCGACSAANSDFDSCNVLLWQIANKTMLVHDFDHRLRSLEFYAGRAKNLLDECVFEDNPIEVAYQMACEVE